MKKPLKEKPLGLSVVIAIIIIKKTESLIFVTIHFGVGGEEGVF